MPVMVAVHGFALGGGIGISGAADIVVAPDCTTFGVPEVGWAQWVAGRICSACFRCKRCNCK